MSTPSVARLAALSLLGWASLACADSSAPRTTAESPAELQLERLWHVGGVDDTTLVFETLTRNDLAVDAQDRIFVIDRSAARIAVLDSTGRLVDRWGTRGPGPGEFLFPLTLAVAPDGALHVYDAEKARILVFASDGRFRDEHLRPAGHPFRFRFRSDTSVVGSTPPRIGGAMRLRAGAAPTWQTLDSVPAGPTGMIESVCGVVGHSVAPVFQPRLAWDARGDTIVSSVGEFAITVRIPGAPDRVLIRDTSRRATDRSMAARELGEGERFQILGRKPCLIPAAILLDVAHIAPFMPAYTDLTLGTNRQLWATRDGLSDEPAMADLFQLDSGYLSTVALGTAQPQAFLRSGVLLSIERDADDVPMIVAYRVSSTTRTAR